MASAQRRLRVAMVGQKGVPATYGGIERHVEELGARLADLDVDVTVYCRRSYADDIPATYRGMRLVVTPTVASKHLDAIVHSFTSTVHAILSGTDVVHYHALGPGLAAPLARFGSRSKVALTVHGLDQERAKWSGLAQRVLGLAYAMSGRVPDVVVTVSRALEARYKADFGRRAVYIPNGAAAVTRGEPLGRLATDFGLEPAGYALFVGRIVPEKRPDLLIEAANGLPDGMKVVIVGDSSFSDEYVDAIKRAADGNERIVLPGYLYGTELAAAFDNAAVFVQPSDLEGLPITLLEALSYRLPVVASDIPPHLEVIADCRCEGHRTFPAGDSGALRDAITATVADRSRRAEVQADADRLLAPYDWDSAARALLDVYASVVRRRAAGEPVAAHPRTSRLAESPTDA